MQETSATSIKVGKIIKNTYFTRGLDFLKNNQKYNQDILYLIDGKNSVLDISSKTKIDFFHILNFINKLADQKIIKKK